MLAFDVADAIDLDHAERLVESGRTRAGMGHSRRAPAYLAVDPPPLRVSRTDEPIEIGQMRTREAVELTLYDFGAISVAYEIELDCALGELRGLADALYDNEALAGRARASAERLLGELGPAIEGAGVGEAVEDYVIYRVAPADGARAPAFVEAQRSEIAQILRAEVEPLSPGEIGEVMDGTRSFGLNDAIVIDWNAAMVVDPKPEDTVVVLEFANVELLEMRHLDDKLDENLDRAFGELSRRSWRDWLPVGSPMRAQVEELAQLRSDGARMFEGVNNALKLLGDQYLARLYRLAADRLGTDAWDASILRKLDALESLNEKLGQMHTHRRMEILEWIIIVLIALSMVQAVVMGK